mgnify:CR=1 FL=1
MKGLEALEELGYFFSAQDSKLAYQHVGPAPDPEVVRPLLAELKVVKEEAIDYLQKRPFTRQTKQIVIFPADTQLAFPSGTWHKLVDGRIKALLSYEELETMRYWRDEIILAGDDNG